MIPRCGCLVLSARAQDITGAANCTVFPLCTGAGGVSCLYCPQQCGSCPSQGVFDHCHEAGTAHLSIDDGPVSPTGQMLDILKDESARLGYPIHASFWLIGRLVAERADVVRRAVADGHAIGSHSFTHDHFNSKPNTDQLRRELNETVAILESTVPGYKITMHRPPYGELNMPVLEAVKAANLTAVLWNGDILDWDLKADVVHSAIEDMMTKFDPASNSWIILSHWIDPSMTCGLSAVIRYVAARGYRWVGIDECLYGRPPGSPPYPLAVRGPLDSNSSACDRPPTFCTDGDFCGPEATCCQPGACCTPYDDGSGLGYCLGPIDINNLTDACGAGCLGGACTECGNPMILHPPLAPFPDEQASDFACPYVPPPIWTRTVIVLIVVIGVAITAGICYLCHGCTETPAPTSANKKDTIPSDAPPPPASHGELIEFV